MVPTQHGVVTLLYHDNAVIGADGSMLVTPKSLPGPFATFDSYLAHLTGTLRSVFGNASDMRRPSRYSGISTVSSGYDSAACAALASMLDCRDAVSLRAARGNDADSGAEVAHALGLRLREFDRPEGANSDSDALAEFLATGMQAEDYVFRAFEEVLPASVLLTGFHGDKVWERSVQPNDTIRRGDVSGSSLGEFRMRVDFVHLPVPFIGCRRHEDIWRISNSEEMQPYSSGGGYDRPVPRRIAEQAGVPRSAFGQSKKAVTLLFFWDSELIPEPVRKEIRSFRKGDRLSLSSLMSYCLRALRWTLAKQIIGLFKNRAPFGKSTNGGSRKGAQNLFARVVGLEFPVFEHSHPRNTVWIRWAISRVQQRYKPEGAPWRPLVG
jgi:hypothetical protein